MFMMIYQVYIIHGFQQKHASNDAATQPSAGIEHLLEVVLKSAREISTQSDIQLVLSKLPAITRVHFDGTNQAASFIACPAVEL